MQGLHVQEHVSVFPFKIDATIPWSFKLTPGLTQCNHTKESTFEPWHAIMVIANIDVSVYVNVQSGQSSLRINYLTVQTGKTDQAAHLCAAWAESSLTVHGIKHLFLMAQLKFKKNYSIFLLLSNHKQLLVFQNFHCASFIPCIFMMTTMYLNLMSCKMINALMT